MAKVDILLPYWGEFSLLQQTVESVLQQTSSDWRLLIFDDCYPSKEAQTYFANQKDPRISYYRHKKNIGITNNFNYALKQASAEYCVMLGCDDILLPTYIETALKNIYNADFYQPNVEVIDKNSNVYLPLGDRIKKLLRPKKAGIYSGQTLATSLCHGNWLYFPSLLWKTETIKLYGFDPKYKIVEDVLLELSVVKNDGKLFVDTETTFQYRRFEESLSSREKSKNGIRFLEEKQIYAKFADEFKIKGWHKASVASRLHVTSRLHQLIS